MTRAEIKVSAYERAASWLLALLVLLGSVVLILLMIWIGSKITVTPTAVPVTMERIEDVGGGFENGVFGEDIEIEGEVTGELGTGAEASEESVEQMLEIVSGVVATQQPLLDDLSEREPWATGGVGGSRGTGNAPSLGEGGGSGGGVKRHLRWIIDYANTETLEIYAAQLGQFGIELGAVPPGDGVQVAYAANLGSPTPTRRDGPKDAEERLYFAWRSGELQAADRQLLSRAGIDSAGKTVLQFFPDSTEQMLARLEMEYLNTVAPPNRRDIRLVRRTRFGVQGQPGSFAFFVKGQTYLGSL